MAISVNRYLTLFFLLAAAGVSYAIGFMYGFWFFLLVGAVFEILFWAGVIEKLQDRAAHGNR